MGAVIGELLPLALGVVLSPLAIIIVIVMLGAPRGRVNAAAFVTGWLGALLAVGVGVLFLADAAETAAGGDEPATLAGVLQLGIGIALLALAGRQWSARPRHGEPAALPAWMASIERVSPARAVGFGAAVAGVKPKNLALTAAAAIAIAEGGLAAGASVGLLIAYALLATTGVAAPLVAALALGSRAAPVLDGWKEWLGNNNAAMMVLLFLVFGVILVGRGIAALA